MKKIFALILVLAIGICLCPAPLYYNYYTTNANPVTGGQATNVFVGSSGGVATVTTNVAGSIYVVNVTTSSVAAITKVPSTRYVSMTGNDTTAVAGNPAQAWSTISNAVRVSSYSDIVHVFPGNYTGQVNAVNGVVVNYELGANHYTPAAQYLYDASGAGITNVQISGLGNLIGSPTTGTTMFNVSNSLCDIFIECNQFASQEIGNADHVLALGSFKSIKIKPRLGKLLSLPSYNTSDSSTFEWWGAPFLAFYQHIDLAGTNRFFNANVNWREWDENNVGKLEFFGGQLNDSPNIGYLNGGIVTLFGSRVLAPTGSKLLDATAYTNYPFATNIYGFWQSVADNTFVAANQQRIENQGGASSLYFVSRSGNMTLATNRVYYDGTNNRVSFQSPLYGNGIGLSNTTDIIPGSNITITTNANGRAYTIAATGGAATTITNNTGVVGVVVGGSGSYGIGTNTSGISGSVTLTNYNGNAGQLVGGSGSYGIGTNTGANFWKYDSSANNNYTNLSGARWSTAGQGNTLNMTDTATGTELGNTGPSRFPYSVFFDEAQTYYVVGDNSPLVGSGVVGDFNLHDGTVNVLGASTANVTTANINRSSYSTNGTTGTVVDFSKTKYSTNIAANLVFAGVSNKDTTGTNYNEAMLVIRNTDSSAHTVAFNGTYIFAGMKSNNWAFANGAATNGAAGNFTNTIPPNCVSTFIIWHQEGNSTNLYGGN